MNDVSKDLVVGQCIRTIKANENMIVCHLGDCFRFYAFAGVGLLRCCSLVEVFRDV